MSAQTVDVGFIGGSATVILPRAGFAAWVVLLSAFCSATSLAVGDRSRPKLPSRFEFGRIKF
jgi:hypothetical protein